MVDGHAHNHDHDHGHQHCHGLDADGNCPICGMPYDAGDHNHDQNASDPIEVNDASAVDGIVFNNQEVLWPVLRIG